MDRLGTTQSISSNPIFPLLGSPSTSDADTKPLPQTPPLSNSVQELYRDETPPPEVIEAMGYLQNNPEAMRYWYYTAHQNQITQLPSHMTEPPGHMTEPPSHMTEPPSQMTQPPSHMTEPLQPPIHMTVPPSHMTQLSGQVTIIDYNHKPISSINPPIQFSKSPLQKHLPCPVPHWPSHPLTPAPCTWASQDDFSTHPPLTEPQVSSSRVKTPENSPLNNNLDVVDELNVSFQLKYWLRDTGEQTNTACLPFEEMGGATHETTPILQPSLPPPASEVSGVSDEISKLLETARKRSTQSSVRIPGLSTPTSHDQTVSHDQSMSHDQQSLPTQVKVSSVAVQTEAPVLKKRSKVSQPRREVDPKHFELRRTIIQVLINTGSLGVSV